jgi:hypothetical protein
MIPRAVAVGTSTFCELSVSDVAVGAINDELESESRSAPASDVKDSTFKNLSQWRARRAEKITTRRTGAPRTRAVVALSPARVPREQRVEGHPPLPRARARRTRGDRPLVRGRTTDAASERAKKEVVARRAHILNDGVVAPAARRRRRHRRLRAHGEEVPEPVQPGAHRAREVRARSRAPDPPASAPAASRASPRE